MRVAFREFGWKVAEGIHKVTPALAGLGAILAFALLVIFAWLGFEAYVLGDLKWAF